ncbi:ThuA domain-containing protein [Lysobacter sp. 5GHs7-4]|uniref:ThuA domain-containing protein n=1 Tax=Lysobacter sp. 5GHs7-4 TaxID=2904253 RepID=UPI001E5730A0|nr:ThuA domain-containing protein [Lysobacter sp. 5GHs7-4]UHQ23041.1 ThuA domain-containing protein [Lysobacter sp. 5GHs7-4]
MSERATKPAPQRRHLLRAWTLLACLWLCACSDPPPRTVVVIGGVASEGPGKHDYPQGVRRLQALIETSPDARKALRVIAYPDGWPQDPGALDQADTVVWYFDGMDRHPLRDRQRRARFEALMRRGVGLVALHQASTAPADDDLGLPRWLGGVRVGMFDRSTEWAQLAPAMGSGPVGHGLSSFDYRDEFYPSFRLAVGGGVRTPVLTTTLHPQFRAGRRLIEDRAEAATVAWTFERDGGGRGFVYSGAHFLSAFEQPKLAGLLLNAIVWSAGADVPREGMRVAGAREAPTVAAAAPPSPRPARATFHVDAARSGWRRDETVLSPVALDAAAFGEVWQSLPLDGADGQPARLYASPLYLDGVTLSAGPLRGETYSVVFAASNAGYVYAIAAAPRGDVAAGRVLWRTRLGEPCRLQPAPLDGVATGILSTPVIDAVRGRLYVTHCDPVSRWQAYALDIGSGALLPGWPVRLDEERFNAVNANAGPRRVPPKRRFDFRVQRGALNLSPDGGQLYVAFGESETGWLAAVDTQRARVGSAFAAVAMPHRGSGGIWGAGGPAVDTDGHVYVVTGSGFEGHQDAAHDWTQSLLKLAPPDGHGFVLRGTYTPFNYCQTAQADIDLGSGGAVLLPQASAGGSRLLAVGGKQGNVYLLDRDRLPGRLDRRSACSEDAASDGSLLPPQPQPQFGRRGPLNVFGPYSEHDAALDLARSRSVPATFRDRQGLEYLYVTGNNKRAPGSAQSVPPSLVRLRVVRDEGDAPFLRIDRRETTLTLGNPGSPVVTSQGAERAVVWVLDENAPRSALLSGDDAPRPVLYAFDAASLKPLWRSAAGELYTSGKYNEPAFGGGRVYVGTDRVQAFGLGGRRRAEPISSKSAVPIRAAPVDPTLAGMDGAALYRLRCAACHDHAQGNIPPRARIAALKRERIVHALSEGLMRPQATGLSAEQVGRLADYLRQGER